MTTPIRKMIDITSMIILLSFITEAFSQRSKNDVLFEYFPSSPKSTSDILKSTLNENDFANKIKILPDKQDVILKLSYKQEISLLYAIATPGPVSLSLSPCIGVLKWTLFYRPYLTDTLEVIQAGNHSINGTMDGFGRFGSSHTQGKSLNELPDPVSDRKKNRKQGSFGMIEIFEGNFTRPELQNPPVKYISKKHQSPILEVEVTRGGGKDPWLYQKEMAQPGLYVIRVQSWCDRAQFQALASRDFISDTQRDREIEAFKVKESLKKQALIIKWSVRSDGENLFCLVVSRHKFYSSLCEARELQKTAKFLPAPMVDGSLILGCTPDTHYHLPSSPDAKFYVSVWQQGSLIPLVQAKVKAKSHRKRQRLKSGVLVPFTLTAGGHISVKFRVKKAGKKLHVAAVSCYGGVKVVVTAGKERIAAAKGREALHLAVRQVPKAKLTIKVSPQPPLQALYRVHLVAAHSARKLPIPRLPKNTKVNVTPMNCTSANITWFKSPGGVSYCVVLQRHPSGRPPEIRPPLQCGWEEVVRRHDYFYYLDCFKGTKERKQFKILTKLPSNGSFLVHILVRHPVTGKTLTLSPSMLNLPKCAQDSNLISFSKNNHYTQNMIF